MSFDNKDDVTVEQFLETARQAENGKEAAWIMASLTDEFILDCWPDMQRHTLDGKAGKVLEIRIFSQRGERKLIRTDIGKAFKSRVLCDGQDMGHHFDEIHYLDINSVIGRDESGFVTSTGGGKYYLPIENIKDAKIRIRYYLDRYEKTGQAKITDWRIVEYV